MNRGSQITPTTNNDFHPKLQGGLLFSARLFWVLFAILGLCLVIYGIPPHYRDLLIAPPPPLIDEWSIKETLHAFSEAGITTEAYAVLTSTLDMVFLLTGGIVGLVIFVRRSNDPISLLTSFVLFNFGIIFSDSFTELPNTSPQLIPLVTAVDTIFIFTLITFLLVFPDGKFIPSWTWRVGLFIFVVYTVIKIFAPMILLDEWNQGVGAAIILAIFGLPSYSQWYRYRNKSDIEQRQQIKWLVLTLVGIFVIFLLMTLAIAFIPWFSQPGGTQVIVHLIFWVIFFLTISMIPISIGIAITRYRLWDINIVINRSIVYGSVTLILGILFLGGFYLIRTLLHILFGADQQLYPAILSTVLITALFSPTRRALRRYVDRRFYGIDLDYTAAIRQQEMVQDRLKKSEPLSHFGKYKVIELIGRGGMGEVYHVEDPDNGQNLALKSLYIRGGADKEELTLRFEREAMTIKSLDHTNIVKLYDYGQENGLPYMVMEYIQGVSLMDILYKKGVLSLQELMPIFSGIASGLDYAHEKGIVHRDVKPSNLIVENLAGSSPRAVLMDFGIARMVSSMTALTGTGAMIGTLDYIAPEQIQGASQVDGRADVYSLGVMVYQTLTGELPFQYRNPGAMIMAHLTIPPPDARLKISSITRNSAKAIIKAMAKDPDDRFATAGDFIAALI